MWRDLTAIMAAQRAPWKHAGMIDTIDAWQCIGCGKIEAPQTCIGVCRDRKVYFIGKRTFYYN